MKPDNKPMVRQSPITVVTQVSPAEVESRIRASASSRGHNGRYEGGSNRENYRVFRGDILLAPRSRHTRRMGDDGRFRYESVISSWNGIKNDSARSELDLIKNYYFAGISLTDFDPAKDKGPSHSLATLVSGPIQIRMNASKNIYAGDTIVAMPPDFNPKRRKMRQFRGQPPNKLHTVIKTLDWKDLQKINQVTYLDAVTPAVLNMPVSQSTDGAISGEEQRALALTKHSLYTFLDSLRNFALRGLSLGITPAVNDRATAIFNALGGDTTGTATNLWELLLLDQKGVDNAVTTDVVETNPITKQNMTFRGPNGEDADIDFFGHMAEYVLAGRVPGGNNASAKSRMKAIDNFTLWAAARAGAVNTKYYGNTAIEDRARVLRESLLHSVHHVYVPPQNRKSHAPNFSLVDPAHSNGIVREYMKNSSDTVIEHEQLQAEHRHDLAGATVGMALSSAAADVNNPAVDVLIGHASGNVVV